MKKRILGNKKIIIRKLRREDVEDVKRFQKFFNSFIEEDAKISVSEKISAKEQKKRLEGSLQKQKEKEAAYLVAKEGENIAGRVYIKRGAQRSSHVATLGALMIDREYRRIGIAKHLIKEAITLAKKEFQPSPKVVRISAFGNNEPALRLYEKKVGFEKVANIPKQLKYKGRYVDEVILLKFLK